MAAILGPGGGGGGGGVGQSVARGDRVWLLYLVRGGGTIRGKGGPCMAAIVGPGGTIHAMTDPLHCNIPLFV